MKELSRRMAAIGENIEDLDAILITHEHTDHVAGAPVLARSRKLKAAVYVTHLTAPAIDWGETAAKIEHFQAGARFTIGDLGYVPESIKYHLRRTDVLLLEANHDLEMLKVGPYPWSVKQRVMSRVGHLSNMGMAEFLLHDFDSATSHLVLGHLSEHNNHPEIVRMVAMEAMQQRSLAATLAIASQHTPSEVIRF
jgi:phosphoribosyl 1,2-cyclic phosphodiesterase